MRSSIASGLYGLRAAIGLALCALMIAQTAAAQTTAGPVAAPASAPPAATPLPGGRPPAAAASAAEPAAAPLQSDPRQVATVLEQATRLQKEGKPEDALKTLDAGLRQAPRDPQLRFLYGVIVAERGRAADAIAVFEQLTADYPELPEPYNNLAVLHAAAGDLDRARAALENAVRALPGYGLAHENLGDLYVRMAMRSYERAAAAQARSDSARAKLAMARELVGRLAPNAGAPAARGP